MVSVIAVSALVKLLGWTSLFTDAATEAIYPLLPVFVTRVLGGGASSLGVIEGAADAIEQPPQDRSRAAPVTAPDAASRSLSSATASRRWLRPLIALAGPGSTCLPCAWSIASARVFVARRETRCSARSRRKGSAAASSGITAAMDHAGAVVGPIAAAAFLWFFPDDYRTLFALTIVPGVIAVAMVCSLPETAERAHRPGRCPAATPTCRHAALGDPPAQALLDHPGLFTLGNSPMRFCFCVFPMPVWQRRTCRSPGPRLHVDQGQPLDDWAARSPIGSAAAADRRWLVALCGRLRRFRVTDALLPLLAWFFAYGVYFALVEGSEKALVADLTPRHLQGTCVRLVQRGAGIRRARREPPVWRGLGSLRPLNGISHGRQPCGLGGGSVGDAPAAEKIK